MAANRFDTSANQEYVSTYVPKPFELMYKLGMGMKQEHEKSQAEADALSDALNKIKVTDQVLVNTPGQGQNGLGYASTGYGKYKNEVINKYSQANKQLADEYATTGDAVKFKQGISKLKNDFNSDYQKLKIAEKNSLAIDEMDKKYRENEEVGRENYLANQVADQGDIFLKDVYNTEYKGSAIGKALDEQESLNKDAQHFADQVGNNSSFKDSHGNVIYRNMHGVIAPRIQDYVDKSYDSTVGIHTKERVKREMIARGIPLDQKLEDGTYYADALYNQKKENYKQALVDKAEKSVLDQNEKKNWLYERSLNKTDEEEAKKIYTTNEQGNPEVLGIEGALNSLGLGDVMTSTGDWKTKDNSTVESTNAGGPGIMSTPILSSIVKLALPSKSAEQTINEGYSKIIAKHKELGLPQPVDATGKPTGKIKEQLYDYALSLAQSRSTTSRLQPTTIQGMNKLYLGKNSDISNMEFYTQGDKGSNAKVTNEKVNSLSGNSTFTGIDYYNEDGAGWKVTYTEKDDDGKTTGVDQALIGVPRDKTFKDETEPVSIISRGAMNFAKTGKIDEKYLDAQLPILQAQVDKNLPGTQLVSSSTEENKNGDIILRGSFVDNSTGKAKLKGVTYNYTKGKIEFSSLDKIQADKTSEVQVKGALTQYNNSLKETTKNSEVELDGESED